MIIDERLIQDGITEQLLAELIEQHERETERFDWLMRYYMGEHDILLRRRSADGLANNRIVCNHAKYITDMSTAYLIGNPISYAADEKYDIEPLKNAYLEQNIARVDKQIVKQASIYGRAYELIYADGNSKACSVCINPRQAFVVYNDDCAHVPLFGVYYYKTYNIDGSASGCVCNVYTDSDIFTYESLYGSYSGLVLTYEDKHYFGGVPLIEYINNDEKQGDFCQLISLIDAYNKLTSDRVNDKEDFVDSFLFLKSVEVDADGAKKLRREKILMSDQEVADAKYLSKALSENDVKILRDNLKEDIHRMAMVPDLSDANFSNNLSGVAIRYKLIAFEQHTKDKEDCIAAGLRTRFTFYNNFLYKKGQMGIVPIHRVDIVFTHNLPVNNYEISQMITNLSGTVTNETLISQLDFVIDPKEEAELAQREQEKRHVREMKEISDYAEGGGY